MTEDILYKVGKMTKKPSTMGQKERRNWEKKIAKNARDYLFSIGQPLVYKRSDGHVVAEYKDGGILIIQ